jgi:hypothetical protein
VAPHSPVEVNGRSGRTYCLHLQRRGVSQASEQQDAVGYFEWLTLPSSTFLRNVGEILPDYTSS